MNMENNSPSSDGRIKEFYSFYWEEVKCIFLNFYQAAIERKDRIFLRGKRLLIWLKKDKGKR